MPFKIWDRNSLGHYTSVIDTTRDTTLAGEEYRTEAEELDAEIDAVLDRAVQLSSSSPDGRRQSREFVKRWAIGRAIAESGILQSSPVASEPRAHLWLAMARKCRLGIRSSHEVEEQWHTLIPNRDLEPQRIERDIFAMGLWLQEQDLEDALTTFGGRLSNAREIQRRESLRSVNLRRALGRWLLSLGPSRRSRLLKGSEFVTIAKALQRRWPSRGLGSAKRPVHFDDQDLDEEVDRALKHVGYTE